MDFFSFAASRLGRRPKRLKEAQQDYNSTPRNQQLPIAPYPPLSPQQLNRLSMSELQHLLHTLNNKQLSSLQSPVIKVEGFQQFPPSTAIVGVPGQLLNSDQGHGQPQQDQPQTSSHVPGQTHQPIDNSRLNSVDSESGYSSSANDTPSSSKSHSPAGSQGIGINPPTSTRGQSSQVQVKVEHEEETVIQLDVGGRQPGSYHVVSVDNNTMFTDSGINFDANSLLSQNTVPLNNQTTQLQDGSNGSISHIANLSSMSINLTNSFNNAMNGTPVKEYVPELSNGMIHNQNKNMMMNGKHITHDLHLMSPDSKNESLMSPEWKQPSHNGSLSPSFNNSQPPSQPDTAPVKFSISRLLPSSEDVQFVHDFCPPPNPSGDPWSPVFTVPSKIAATLISHLPAPPAADEMLMNMSANMLTMMMNTVKPELLSTMLSDVSPKVMAAVLPKLPQQFIHSIMANLKPRDRFSLLSKMTPQMTSMISSGVIGGMTTGMLNMLNADAEDPKDDFSKSSPVTNNSPKRMILGVPYDPCQDDVSAMIQQARQPCSEDRLELINTVTDVVVTAHLETCLFISKRLHRSLTEFIKKEANPETVSVRPDYVSLSWLIYCMTKQLIHVVDLRMENSPSFC